MALAQRVAGGEGSAVAATLGPEALGPAFAAFLAGYRVALTTAALALVVAAAVAFVGMREPAQSRRRRGARSARTDTKLSHASSDGGDRRDECDVTGTRR
jgi:hypothetical protein